MAKKQNGAFDWSQSGNQQMSMLASANGAFLGMLAKGAQNYAESISKLTQEYSNFLCERLERDAALGEKIAKCKDWSEISEAQQEWLQEAGQEYATEAQKAADIGMKFFANGSSMLPNGADFASAKSAK
ncbi:MAG: phasin family protein [Rhodospirillaceae bacterium]